MRVGLFGYPGENLVLVKAMYEALIERGAESLVCLGGLVWSGKKDDPEMDPPATVLRWLRTKEIPTLANDMDRQVAGWRLQALQGTTGYVRPRVRKFLSALTREEAQWIYQRPSSMTVGPYLCCTDTLTIEAVFPVPLTRFNAVKLFSAMEQKVAIFPSSNGPSLVVRKQEDGTIEGKKYEHTEELLDAPKMAAVIGGVVGYPPLNHEISFGAIADSATGRLTIICMDSHTHRMIPEKAALLIQEMDSGWSGS